MAILAFLSLHRHWSGSVADTPRAFQTRRKAASESEKVLTVEEGLDGRENKRHRLQLQAAFRILQTPASVSFPAGPRKSSPIAGSQI